MSELLRVENLTVHFPMPQGIFSKPRYLHAVNGVSFNVTEGETLGIVGESGCGKSTLARAVLGLIPSTSGDIYWRGENTKNWTAQQRRDIRKEIQIVFQDPLAALNPRMTIGEIISEPLHTHEPNLSLAQRQDRVRQTMAAVGLSAQTINRYPHEFSGGQCQRVGIARAIILRPKLLLCDEAVSALDVSIQAQILNLLQDLRDEYGLSLLFISHNLSVVRHISQRVMVLYLGRAVEISNREALYQGALHPYTQALLSAVPLPDPIAERARKAISIKGDLPSPLAPPSGCVFRTRCAQSIADCAQTRPELKTIDTRQVACIRVPDA